MDSDVQPEDGLATTPRREVGSPPARGTPPGQLASSDSDDDWR